MGRQLRPAFLPRTAGRCARTSQPANLPDVF